MPLRSAPIRPATAVPWLSFVRHGPAVGGLGYRAVLIGEIVVVVEVAMAGVDALVVDGNRDALARIVVPDAGHVDVVSGSAVQMPLTGRAGRSAAPCSD